MKGETLFFSGLVEVLGLLQLILNLTQRKLTIRLPVLGVLREMHVEGPLNLGPEVPLLPEIGRRLVRFRQRVLRLLAR